MNSVQGQKFVGNGLARFVFFGRSKPLPYIVHNACLQGHFYDAVNWHTQAERLQKAVRLLRIL